MKRLLAICLMLVVFAVPGLAGNSENPGITDDPGVTTQGNSENPGVLFLIVNGMLYVIG